MNWRPIAVFVIGVILLVTFAGLLTGCRVTAPRQTSQCKIVKKEIEVKRDARNREVTEYEFDCADGREVKVSLVTFNGYSAGQTVNI